MTHSGLSSPHLFGLSRVEMVCTDGRALKRKLARSFRSRAPSAGAEATSLARYDTFILQQELCRHAPATAHIPEPAVRTRLP